MSTAAGQSGQLSPGGVVLGVAALLAGAAIVWWGMRPGIRRALRCSLSIESAERASASERAYRALKTAWAAPFAWMFLTIGTIAALGPRTGGWGAVGALVVLAALLLAYVALGLVAAHWRRREHRERARHRAELGWSPGRYLRPATHVAWLWGISMFMLALPYSFGDYLVVAALTRRGVLTGAIAADGTFTGAGHGAFVGALNAYILLSVALVVWRYYRQKRRIAIQETRLRDEELRELHPQAK